MASERETAANVDALVLAMKREAREALQEFRQSAKSVAELHGPANPLHLHAQRLFQTYLAHRPATAAIDACSTALKMWAELSGVSHLVRDACSRLDSASVGCTRSAARALLWSHQRDGDLARGVAAINYLADRPDAAGHRTPLLYELGVGYFELGDFSAATTAMQRVLDLRENAWHIELTFAEGYMREMRTLNVGQVAPDFVACDLAGNEVSLRAYRGRLVLLHFWTTGCSCCAPLLADLGGARTALGSGELAIIGVALEADTETLRSAIARARMEWPQIAQPDGWHGPLVRLYNVTGVPRAYLIDREGLIAYKGSSGEELQQVLRRHCP